MSARTLFTLAAPSVATNCCMSKFAFSLQVAIRHPPLRQHYRLVIEPQSVRYRTYANSLGPLKPASAFGHRSKSKQPTALTGAPGFGAAEGAAMPESMTGGAKLH